MDTLFNACAPYGDGLVTGKPIAFGRLVGRREATVAVFCL